MKPELSFLLEILLEHRLQKSTKDLLKTRIQELEERTHPIAITRVTPVVNGQAPSMAAKVQALEAEKNGTIEPQAASPAAAQALQARQQAISAALNAGPFGGKPEPGRSSPRKF